MFCKAIFSIHTCVTDGTSKLFTPRKITDFLCNEGIQLAAITDVNTCLNAPAFSICCKKSGISALYGMEAWCRDKKAIVLFPSLTVAMDFNSAWYVTLPAEMPEQEQAKNFLLNLGPQQFCVAEDDSVISIEKKYLQVRSAIPFDELKKQAESKGGLVFNLETLPLQYRQKSPQEIEDLRNNFLLLNTGREGLLTEDEMINLEAIRKGFECFPAS